MLCEQIKELGNYCIAILYSLFTTFLHLNRAPDFNCYFSSQCPGIVDSARKSLFFYQPEESWDTFYDPFFHPSYKPNFTNPELELEANEICGDDVFCLFDIAVTGIKEVGIATHESSQLIEEINTYSIPGNNPLQCNVHTFAMANTVL